MDPGGVPEVPLDPGRAPGRALPPAVGIEVEGQDVHARQVGEGQGVDPLPAVLGPIRRARDAVEALVADGDQVVRVVATDEGAHVVRPMGQGVRPAVARLGVGPRALAARLVGQFPGHDRGIVLVGDLGVDVPATEQVGDPGLVPRADRGVGAELVVVPVAPPAHVLVHPAEAVPVVHEGDDQLDPQLALGISFG